MGRTRARRRARPVSPPQFGLRFTDIFLDNERSRSSVLDADKSFLPLGRNVFRHRALSVEKNKGTP